MGHTAEDAIGNFSGRS